MLLLKTDTEWTGNHEANHTLTVNTGLWDLHPKNHPKEFCGRCRAQPASDNFVKGRCDPENLIDYMTNALMVF